MTTRINDQINSTKRVRIHWDTLGFRIPASDTYCEDRFRKRLFRRWNTSGTDSLSIDDICEGIKELLKLEDLDEFSK
eukprot:CAMPEP_0116989536 /NCGR_PEP_ID=MMETSP0467-20121206/64878_1 /TAXON_ID=283647 /ORGANISM="Mesodinium pulex, Strain SPMC105" /LENGTH=76 /DNA_ID=CAMNT_0004686001 /DNA_START=199 /DNA_END=429 /DNA_ORIENTATION=+